jgi:hypothetical protein
MESTTPIVEGKGGNQYQVTIKGKMEMVDLDGLTIVSNEDYDKLEEELGEASLETFISPQHYAGDIYWLAAVTEVLRYSGFDVDSYISENK